MKDITITKQRQKTELKVFAICLAIAFALNIYAIIVYDGKWSEIFWSLGFVVATAVTLYVLSAALRLCIYIIRRMARRK